MYFNAHCITFSKRGCPIWSFNVASIMSLCLVKYAWKYCQGHFTDDIIIHEASLDYTHLVDLDVVQVGPYFFRISRTIKYRLPFLNKAFAALISALNTINELFSVTIINSAGSFKNTKSSAWYCNLFRKPICTWILTGDSITACLCVDR